MTVSSPPALHGAKSYTVIVNNRQYNVIVAENSNGFQVVPASSAPVISENASPHTIPAEPQLKNSGDEGMEVQAPTPGNILKVLVEVGDQVEKDQALVMIEAMKMESEVKSPVAGKILALHVSNGDMVQASEPLLTIG